MNEACTIKFQGTQDSNWGATILAEAKHKGPILFSGTDWVVVPLESLSPSRRSIIHPISQRLAVAENTALVDGLFGRIWEFPKCENVRERKVTRGDQFVGDSRIDFQWNKTERTLCRVCGKHILKQKFATEHYQRSPTCWRLVMKHIGINDFDSIQGLGGGSPGPKGSPYKTEDGIGHYKSPRNSNLTVSSSPVQSTCLLSQPVKTVSSPSLSPVSSGQVINNDKKSVLPSGQLGSGGIQGTNQVVVSASGQITNESSNINNLEVTSGVYIPTSNVEYILQNKSMNMFRSATKRIYEELIKFRGTGGVIDFRENSSEDSLEFGVEGDSRFDSRIIENIMGDARRDGLGGYEKCSNEDGLNSCGERILDSNKSSDALFLGGNVDIVDNCQNVSLGGRERSGFLNRNFLRFSGINTSEEPYLLISSILPNIFPSISHRPLPVNVCYIKLTFNWPGARLVRDLWALDCELLVDWGDGVLTQARRFTLRELGEPPEADNEMRNIYSQGFAYLKCFVPHKPPGRADLKIRIPKSLWEYWEAFSNDKNNAVIFHAPQIFASNQVSNSISSNNFGSDFNTTNKTPITLSGDTSGTGIVGPLRDSSGNNTNRKIVPYPSKEVILRNNGDNCKSSNDSLACSCQSCSGKTIAESQN